MSKLAAASFKDARNYLVQKARPVDLALFRFIFENGPRSSVLEALGKYQNPDGGFGHGLEPDFELKASSPIAATVAFQIMEAAGCNHGTPCQLAKDAIFYFLSTYNWVHERWLAVPPQVNQDPHAPWWHYDHEQGGSVIDKSWGNPTAEIIGYLNSYPHWVPEMFLTSITRQALDYLLNCKELGMHELLCFIRLINHLPEVSDQVEQKIVDLALNMVETEPDKWGEYVANPLFLVHSPASFLYNWLKDSVDRNLEYLIATQNPDGSWSPNWKWGQYPEAWEKAKMRWTGHLTLNNLRILAAFDRI